MPREFGDLLHGDGVRNMGSLGRTIYYCRVSECANIPAIKAEASDMDDIAIISDNITFNTGFGWKKMHATQDTGMLECAPQGDIDGVSFRNAVTFNHPGNKAAALGFVSKVANTDLLLLVFDAEGNKRLVGSELYPAKYDPGAAGITTGQTAADKKGLTMAFFANSPVPAVHYEGVITLQSDVSSVV